MRKKCRPLQTTQLDNRGKITLAVPIPIAVLSSPRLPDSTPFCKAHKTQGDTLGEIPVAHKKLLPFTSAAIHRENIGKHVTFH